MLRWAALAILSSTVVASGGCSIDFDRFRGDGGMDGAMPDAGDGGMSDGEIRDVSPLAPGSPALLWPWNGWSSGSVHASAGSPAMHPLRPRLRWRPVADATSYDLRVGTSCSGSLSSCSVEGLELEVSELTGTEHTPESSLSASVTPPVGARYYWQVRACNADACSAWSVARYLDVGRLKSDFDGDGYSDLLVGVPGEGTGRVHVFRGGSGGIETTPGLTLSEATGTTRGYGVAVAALGDVDGDGFPDAAVGTDDGRIFLYRGSRTGLMPGGQELTLPGGPPYAGRVTLAGPGDIDGDGDADLLVGAQGFEVFGESGPTGAAFVFYASSSLFSTRDYRLLGVAERESMSFCGASVAGVGDVDADGFPDLAVGAFIADAGGRTDAGSVYFYRGSSMGLGASEDALLTSATMGPEADGYFGSDISGGGDLDDDGYADVVVGAMGVSGGAGGAFVFRGGEGALSGGTLVGPDAAVVCPGPAMGASCGNGVSFERDLDGDGVVNLALAATHASHPENEEGIVHLFSVVGNDPVPTALLDNPRDQIVARFGETLLGYSDYDGDGLFDLAVSARLAGANDLGSVFIYYGRTFESGATGELPDADVGLDNPGTTADSYFGAAIAAARTEPDATRWS